MDTVFRRYTLTGDRLLCFYKVSVCNNPLLRTYVARPQDQLENNFASNYAKTYQGFSIALRIGSLPTMNLRTHYKISKL